MNSWHDQLQPFRGLHFGKPPECDLFRFMTQGEADIVVNDRAVEVGLEEFYPVGWLGTGDFVCAHSNGKLFVVTCANFEWWDVAISLQDLIERAQACDETLEEDVYKSA
jgi:hypothetical protein